MIVEDREGIEYGHAADCAKALAESGIPNAHQLVRDWVRRGKLESILEFDGRPVYRMSDVYEVELATRRNGKRGRKLTNGVVITHR